MMFWPYLGLSNADTGVHEIQACKEEYSKHAAILIIIKREIVINNIVITNIRRTSLYNIIVIGHSSPWMAYEQASKT